MIDFHRLLDRRHFSTEPRLPYERLIRADRLRPSALTGRSLAAEMLSDKARIVTSTAFRRLQTKAQVFSLDRNAAVRTRLTHTLEVAIFGELIAGKVAAELVNKGILSSSLLVPFVQVVENACLLHDAGNPPFGHLGEFAIRDWFDRREARLKKRWRETMQESEFADHFAAFKHFDGNPQGLRIVSLLQWHRDPYGLNLTCSLLAALIKYLGLTPKDHGRFRKKAGIFSTELELARTIWGTLGLKCDEDALLQRHPLSFLMEAADDIAYCVSDIEDAIEKRVVTQDEFFNSLDGDWFARFEQNGEPLSPSEHYKNARFLDFRISLTRYLVDRAAEAYIENHEGILDGSFTGSLLDSDPTAQTALAELKKYAKMYIFTSREAVDVEVSGFRIVQGLLDGFERLLLMTPEEFHKVMEGSLPYGEKALERRLFSLLSNRHLLAYRHQAAKRPTMEPAVRAHLVVDYISGMTDSHAVKIFNMLTGASAGGGS